MERGDRRTGERIRGYRYEGESNVRGRTGGGYEDTEGETPELPGKRY